MIRMSQARKGEALHTVVIVAFDRVSGRVHGTFVHGSHGTPDRAGVERDRERFVAELRGRLGGAELDTVELPFDQLERGSIERIDPRTRQPILRAEVVPVSLLRP
jgi:hypothetical protein